MFGNHYLSETCKFMKLFHNIALFVHLFPLTGLPRYSASNSVTLQSDPDFPSKSLTDRVWLRLYHYTTKYSTSAEFGGQVDSLSRTS